MDTALDQINQKLLLEEKARELRQRLDSPDMDVQARRHAAKSAQWKVDEFLRNRLSSASAPRSSHLSPNAAQAERIKAVEEGLDDYGREQLGKLRTEAKVLEDEADAAQASFDALNAEISETDTALAEFKHLVTQHDLTEFQERFTGKVNQTAAIQSLIDEQRRIIAKAQADLATAGELETQRESLLADIAMGQAKETDLKTLDKQIVEAKGKAAETLDKANQTLQGLTAKLATVGQVGSQHTTRNYQRELLVGYLATEAEAEAENYVKLAGQLTQSFKRILALNNLTLPLGGRDFSGDYWGNLHIPAFPLQACQGCFSGKGELGVIFMASSLIYGNPLEPEINKERETIQACGADLLPKVLS